MRARGVPNCLLLAPDKFKGTFTALEVACALARGITGRAGASARSRAGTGGDPTQLTLDICPLADGGEGTLSALVDALALKRIHALASDPLGRPLEAELGIGARGVAVVEVAAASGLALLDERERDPVRASSYGTGELIAAALEAGASQLYVAAGGSATVDAGAGALQALRERLGDDPRATLAQRGAQLTVLCDVRTPFEQAARVFGPQKGADQATVRRLSDRLERFARAAPHDPRGVPMSGAAGGLAGGLWAALDARLEPGAAFVLGALGYDARMRAARAVVVGEGRLDRQSLAGKALCEAATRARQAGVPCHAVVGQNALERFDARILDLQLVLEASSLDQLEAAGARIAEHILSENARGR